MNERLARKSKDTVAAKGKKLIFLGGTTHRRRLEIDYKLDYLVFAELFRPPYLTPESDFPGRALFRNLHRDYFAANGKNRNLPKQMAAVGGWKKYENKP